EAWWEVGGFLLVAAARGLPINDLVRFALLVVASLLVVAGTVSARAKLWACAVAVVGLCVLGQLFLAVPRIDEGHNVFIVDRPGGALEAGLPPEAFRFMLAQLDARSPPQRRCAA